MEIEEWCTGMVQGETMQREHHKWCGQSSWGANNLTQGETPVIMCKPMQMVRVAQCAFNCDASWPIVCQGDHDEKIILPSAKREVEDATPGRGKIQRSSVFLAFGVLVQKISLTEKLLTMR